MSRLITLLLGAALGAAAVYFLHRRASQAEGAHAQAWPSTPAAAPAPAPAPAPVDDVTLTHKVQSEIFRDADAPKADVSVDVEAGVAHLRGTVEDDRWIDRLADDAKKVDGVKGVENLLQTPETPAPAPEPREPEPMTEERRY
jgi:osmotically-inducible protein OsmY